MRISMKPIWLSLLGGLLLPLDQVAAKPAHGILQVQVSGFEHERGQVVAKLFRRGDGAPKGPGFRKLVQRIQKRRAVLVFRDLAYDSYAVFLFHDENANGKVDHNVLGLPKEPLGFSGGFRMSLLSGVPDFEDLKFEFTRKTGAIAITVE
jgi:uncharacterized protein (DUF2141 family)